jgi:hypothetical protein
MAVPRRKKRHPHVHIGHSRPRRATRHARDDDCINGRSYDDGGFRRGATCLDASIWSSVVSPLPPGACFNSGRAWAATVDDIEHADMLVFDLDPGEGVAWDFVVATAVRMRELFEKEGLAQWPKLTGGKGLHLVAPLSGKAHARCRARLCAPAGAAAREHRSGELHHLGRAGATAGQAVHRLPAQRPRHDRGRRLFTARARDFPSPRR